MRSARRVPSLFVWLVIISLAAITVGCGAVQQTNSFLSGQQTLPILPATLPAPPPPPPPLPSPTPPPSPAPPPPPVNNDVQHVFIVVEENKDFFDVIGNADMPYLNSLVRQYAVATNYFASGIDSLPNYFMLTTGDTIAKDASFSGTVTQDNIVRELVAGDKTWKVYAEGLPSVGYLGPDQPPYVKVHNPFAYFSDVLDSSALAGNIVPMTEFAADLAAGILPNYAFIIPNNSSNSHDCPPNMNSCVLSDTLTYSDTWLKTNLGPLLAHPEFQQHGLLIITWDESRTSTTVNGGGHVATVLVGATVKPGYQSSTFYQHQSSLRLTMRLLGLKSYPAQAATAPDMDEFFSKPLP